MPYSQDQWEQMVPRSSAGMDGFPQAWISVKDWGRLL